MDQRGIRLLKPTVRERAARAVVPLGMSLALATGMLAWPMTALADDGHAYESATIAVTQNPATVNQNAVFNAYKVFDADIDGNNQASNVRWASADAKAATLAFFNTLDGAESYSLWLAAKNYVQQGARDNAQNAAEFIAERIARDGNVDYWPLYDRDNPQAKVGGSFTDRFARAIVDASPALSYLTSTVTSQQNYLISGGTEGYYLIVTDPASIGSDESGMAPMWVPMGGSLTTLQAKAAATGISFTVGEDKTGLMGSIADANIGQDTTYRMTTSYPGNLEAFSTYSDTYTFSFDDGISTASGSDQAGAKINAADFSITLSGNYVSNGGSANVDVTLNGYNGVTLTPGEGEMVVGVADMMPILREIRRTYEGFTPTTLTIAYDAHLNPDALMGATGNATVMTRTYTADPVSLATATTHEYRVAATAYQARITKIDKSNKRSLQGAGFTIVADTGVTADSLDATKQASDPVYVQEDGSLGTSPYEFTTNASGHFIVRGLDEGTYTLHESTVPAGYDAPVADTVLVMSSALDHGSGTSAFTASVSGGEVAAVEGDASTMVTTVTAMNGMAYVQVTNSRALIMPGTGLQGNAGLYAIAAGLALAGLTAVLVGTGFRRKEDERG